jgi:hypothetical protein
LETLPIDDIPKAIANKNKAGRGQVDVEGVDELVKEVEECDEGFHA